MRLLGPRVFVKTGAEGVYCAALPEQGFGIAVKCDDGGGRAAEAVTATAIARSSRSKRQSAQRWRVRRADAAQLERHRGRGATVTAALASG